MSTLGVLDVLILYVQILKFLGLYGGTEVVYMYIHAYT